MSDEIESAAAGAKSEQEERDDYFFVTLGDAVEAARIGGLRVRLTLKDGAELAAVPGESPLAEGRNVTEIDHSGVRADLVLGDTVVMLERVRAFAIERPEGGEVAR